MDNTSLVPSATQNVHGETYIDSRFTATTTWDGQKTSYGQKADSVGNTNLQKYVHKLNISEASKSLIMSSWREGTQDKYNTNLRKWEEFCSNRVQDMLHPNVEEVIDFLTEQLNTGLSYRTILGIRSAINSICTMDSYSDITKHPLLRRHMRGIFNINPPQPRYAKIWDISLVFNFIVSLGDNATMPFINLSRKVATLLILLSGKRKNSIDSFDVDRMDLTPTSCTFIPGNLLKHSRPNFPIQPITYRHFPHKTSLCPVQAIADYYVRRLELKMVTVNTKFFVISTPPYSPAHKDTIGNWVKWTLSNSGVNTNMYKPHSCRSASTSKASSLGMPLHTILQSADWSNEKTFYNYYKKVIEEITPQDEEDYGSFLLNKMYNT